MVQTGDRRAPHVCACVAFPPAAHWRGATEAETEALKKKTIILQSIFTTGWLRGMSYRLRMGFGKHGSSQDDRDARFWKHLHFVLQARFWKPEWDTNVDCLTFDAEPVCSMFYSNAGKRKRGSF